VSDLPVAVTRLVGRDEELIELRQLLAHTRLLTLVGTGGVGKTRLAIELARTVQDTYADGVRLVQMVALADGQLVPQTVAVASGVRERPDRSLIEQVAQTLKDQHLLLVLDNCEHVLDACVEVAERVLTTCPRVSILVTSRERLGLTGETSWRVPSLSFPWLQTPLRIDRVGEYGAVRLFLERAVEAVPGFTITSADEASIVAAICFGLDGIPLALELAAARLSVLSLEDLAERLDDRFRLLARSHRGGLARHQTLRTSVDWSHDLLTAAEQAAFRRLSVFAGGWTLEAAEAVLGQEDALDLLARLVDKSLVQRSERGGSTRYAFLETIRAYAAERLAASGEEAEWRERHATYYLEFAEVAGPGVRARDQLRYIQELDADLDNLRAAARWFSVESQRSGQGLRLAAALWEFWQIRSYFGEASRWLEAALEAESASSLVRAEALNGLGVIYGLCGDHERSRRLFGESAQMFGVLGGLVGQAMAMCHVTLDAAMYNDARQAVELGQQALALARASGDKRTEAFAQYQLAWAYRAAGDADAALCCSAEAASRFDEVGDQRACAFAVAQLGSFLLDAGRARDALGPLHQAAATFRELGEVYGLVAQVLSHLIQAEAELGAFDAAARHLGAVRTLRAHFGAELLPAFQQVEARAEAVTRTALGRSGFEAAVAQGGGMSLEEVLAEFVDAADPAGSQAPTDWPSEWSILTNRERQVAALIAEGLSNRQIAERLVIAERTADTHVQNILGKLGYSTRTQIATHLEPKLET
jgi:non-specific serine/threonine protein kinase